MLESQGESDYHTFRIPYWDWRRGSRSDEIFRKKRLGVSELNKNGQYQVSGDLFGRDGWNTIRWHNGSGNEMRPKGTICNPNINTGPLLRCPLINGTNVCDDKNPSWPTKGDVDNAISKPDYDTDSFDKMADPNSFRNAMEGFDGSVSRSECAKDNLCLCGNKDFNCTGKVPTGPPLKRLLHDAVGYL